MKNYNLLILDDESYILLALRTFLESNGYNVSTAESIEEARKVIKNEKVDLYILDFYLKEGYGTDFLREIRTKYNYFEPAIILTGAPNEEIFKESFKNECNFFLQKDKAIPDLLSVIERLLNSEFKNNQEENLFLKPLPYLIETIKKSPQEERILIKIDGYPLFSYKKYFQNNFSEIIEEMLLTFYYHLQKNISAKNVEAQVTESGAEIIISLLIPHREENKIREIVRAAMVNVIKFMRQRIKEAFHFFNVKIIPFSSKSKNLRLELYYLLQMKERVEPIPLNSLNFRYFFQGIFETSLLKLRGYEIFSRPEEFEDIERFYKKLEKLHIHGHMDHYNIKNTKKIVNNFPDNLFISINISPSSLLIKNFSRNIIKQLEGLSKNVFLEFTERTPNLTDKTVKEKIAYLKKNGFKISIDDVGSGYNNISAILNIEPDMIKIDKILIHKISKDKYKKDAFLSILEFSRKMGALVCAEGVEEEEDFITLKGLNPDYLQGYYLHYPEKINEEIEERKVV